MTEELIKKKSKTKSQYAPAMPLEKALDEAAEAVGAITGPHWHVTRTAFPTEGSIGKDVVKNFRTENDAKHYVGMWYEKVMIVWHIPKLDDIHYTDMRADLDRVVVDKKYKAKLRKCEIVDCVLGSWQPD